VEVETAKEGELADESGTGVPPVTEIKKRRGAYLRIGHGRADGMQSPFVSGIHFPNM